MVMLEDRYVSHPSFIFIFFILISLSPKPSYIYIEGPPQHTGILSRILARAPACDIDVIVNDIS